MTINMQSQQNAAKVSYTKNPPLTNQVKTVDPLQFPELVPSVILDRLTPDILPLQAKGLPEDHACTTHLPSLILELEDDENFIIPIFEKPPKFDGWHPRQVFYTYNGDGPEVTENEVATFTKNSHVDDELGEWIVWTRPHFSLCGKQFAVIFQKSKGIYKLQEIFAPTALVPKDPSGERFYGLGKLSYDLYQS